MFCRNCGHDIGQARFCSQCGTDSQPAYQAAQPGAQPNPGANTTENIAVEFTDKVKSAFDDITGGDKKGVEFKLGDLLSDVMVKHSKEESDELLVSGTVKHTPTPAQMADNWNKPWLYSRVLAILALTFVLLVACTYLFNNDLWIPDLVFIGSMMMPFTLLVLFWETNIPRNISIFELVKMFFVGGVLSLVFTLTLFSILPSEATGVGEAILVGIVEEIGKLVAVAIFIHNYKSKYILNGILIGAAIGAGFAAFESAGYALVYGGDLNGILEIILLRGVLAAGGHIVWAAMSGAAIMLAKGEGEFSSAIFGKGKFWKLFIVPVVLHSVWDIPQIAASVPLLIVLVIIAWVFILALIRTGMGEVSRVSARAKAEAEAAEPVAE